MKDCTFVVNIDGEKTTYDFDGFRAFLMKNENLSAIAPQFYGVQGSQGGSAKKGTPAPPRKLKQQGPVSAPPTKLTVDELYGKRSAQSLEPLSRSVPAESMYKTGAEARKALLAQVDKFTERREKLREAVVEARTPLLVASKKRTLKEQEEMEAAFLKASQDYADIQEQQRLDLLDIVAPGGVADIKWQPYQVKTQTIKTGRFTTTYDDVTEEPFSPEITKSLQRGVDFFKRIAGDHPALRGQKIGIFIRSDLRRGRAAYYSSEIAGLDLDPLVPFEEASIRLTEQDLGARVIVHELGHWLEDLSTEIQKSVVQFLKRRTKNEVPRPLRDIVPGSNYDKSEIAVVDDFIDPYIGSYYSVKNRKSGKIDWDAIDGSEVISLGLQYLYEDPVRFAQQDPDMFDFIFDAIREGR